ncbi:peptidoglycan-binding protein [Methylomonas sp. MK1]|uniref:peptidoglycan-binding protein n=1 Tax=Methylomonas sp. MK1 TaxID=1131552 RepID=UPI000366FE94|nr:peptidoglycan-binding protein [Methylomonas sp. MK1]
MAFSRPLKFQLPMLRGRDVLEVQTRLKALQINGVGQPDGLFGAKTSAAVVAFQTSRGLDSDGIVGPLTWSSLFQDDSFPNTQRPAANDAGSTIIGKDLLDELKAKHAYQDSVPWQLTVHGLLVGNDNAPLGSGGEPKTVAKIWSQYGSALTHWSTELNVPVELIIATICTESSGNQNAVREEPGFIDEVRTPHKISPGLMQTLISTARAALNKDDIDKAWLLVPSNSIQAGTAYIAGQWKQTHFDPPKVACAYNAGGIYRNDSARNRWKMRQYPIGSAEHADRFVKWFNDCFVFFENDGGAPEFSFFNALRK